jgi:hypothetical protein
VRRVARIAAHQRAIGGEVEGEVLGPAVGGGRGVIEQLGREPRGVVHGSLRDQDLADADQASVHGAGVGQRPAKGEALREGRLGLVVGSSEELGPAEVVEGRSRTAVVAKRTPERDALAERREPRVIALRAADRPLRGECSGNERRRLRVAKLALLAALGEARERANCLQHPEAVGRPPQQALVDERRDALERRPADRLGYLERERSEEDGRAREELAVVRVQQPVAPVDRPMQRALPLRDVPGAARPQLGDAGEHRFG